MKFNYINENFILENYNMREWKKQCSGGLRKVCGFEASYGECFSEQDIYT